MENLYSQYQPDDVSAPGETLLETLEKIGVSQAELAVRMGRPKKTINEIIKGKTAITPETALQLELALGIPATFWNERERRYQEAIARAAQRDRFTEWANWLNQIPYGELIQRGWLERRSDRSEMVRDALQFFGVVSPEQWKTVWESKVGVSFRKAAASTNDIAVATWLRKAEIIGQSRSCAPYEESAFRQALDQLRELTRQTPTPRLYHHDLIELCASLGVAIALVPTLDKSRVFGACEWLSPRKALIALSDFYKSDDIFWFNLFHEIGHLLLHSKKGVFLDQELEDSSPYIANINEEEQANAFARDVLIPFAALQTFIATRPPHRSTGKPFFDEADICSFAREMGVAPSIVVGRLQHDGVVEYRYLQQFKSSFEIDNTGQVLLRKVAAACW